LVVANIDADFLVYRAAAACEGKFWMYKGQRYEKKLLLNKVLKKDGVEGMEIPQESKPETWEDCKRALKSISESVIDQLDTQWEMHISGKGNFRYKYATILPYKGNRTGAKPFHYDNCRQFLVDAYDAKVSQGMEADDAVCLAGGITASLDKDLDCRPGTHFNWEKDLWYEVSLVDANRWFYTQLLTGDSVDNILGLFGVGDKSAAAKKLKTLDTEEEMLKLVTEQYDSRFGSYSQMFLKENAILLWILQERDNLILGEGWNERLFLM